MELYKSSSGSGISSEVASGRHGRSYKCSLPSQKKESCSIPPKFLSADVDIHSISCLSCRKILDALCEYCDLVVFEDDQSGAATIDAQTSIRQTLTERPKTLSNCFFEPFRPSQWTELSYFTTPTVLDLGIVLRKLVNFKYKNLEEFASEVRQVLQTIRQICSPPKLSSLSEGDRALSGSLSSSTKKPIISTAQLSSYAVTLLRYFDALLESERLNVKFLYYEKRILDNYPDVEIGLSTMVDLLTFLQNHPLSAPFREPVDYVGLNLPNYLTIVKSPMDLSTIYCNLVNGEYDVSAILFARHVRQVWKNSMIYNDAKSEIYVHAKQLAYAFEAELQTAYRQAFRLYHRYGRYSARDQYHRLLMWDFEAGRYYLDYFESRGNPTKNWDKKLLQEKWEAWQSTFQSTEYPQCCQNPFCNLRYLGLRQSFQMAKPVLWNCESEGEKLLDVNSPCGRFLIPPISQLTGGSSISPQNLPFMPIPADGLNFPSMPMNGSAATPFSRNKSIHPTPGIQRYIEPNSVLHFQGRQPYNIPFPTPFPASKVNSSTVRRALPILHSPTSQSNNAHSNPQINNAHSNSHPDSKISVQPNSLPNVQFNANNAQPFNTHQPNVYQPNVVPNTAQFNNVHPSSTQFVSNFNVLPNSHSFNSQSNSQFVSHLNVQPNSQSNAHHHLNNSLGQNNPILSTVPTLLDSTGHHPSDVGNNSVNSTHSTPMPPSNSHNPDYSYPVYHYQPQQ